MEEVYSEKVLLALAREAGEYVSGQRLAGKLRVSRTAVWKKVAALRKLGYRVDSSRKLGYRLAHPPDPLLPSLVEGRLKTRRLGRKVVYHPLVTSTMDVAAQLLAAGAREGTVVVAERQLAGRGRQGRAWSSPAGGGLWLSVILRPAVSPLLVGRLTLAAACALCEAVEGLTGLSPRVKWPNDLYLEGGKLAGILTEMGGEIDMVSYLVLGVGINVNGRRGDFPPELRRLATSLAECGAGAVDRRELLARFLQRLEDYYGRLKRGDLKGVLAGWREREMTLGRRVTVREAGRELRGVAEELGEDGALIVRQGNGVLRRIYCGDVMIEAGGRRGGEMGKAQRGK